MIVEQEHLDGTRTVIYEPGDRVRLRKVPHHASWLAKAGELATVIRRDRPRIEGQPTCIDFLDVQTDAMKAGGWGSIHLAPWDLEDASNDNSTT